MSGYGGKTRVAVFIVLIAFAAIALRTVFLTADPPTHTTVGIVWHDEGPWVHNARNRVLWGTWRTDAWNPVFVAPVFTALEYAAFSMFGVGTWQARTVPVVSGVFTVAVMMLGLGAVAGRRAAVVGGALLATNYVLVMWNRAALMESTMTACLAGAWAAYAIAHKRPWTGLLAGVMAVAAFFTKAAAAFFIGALGIDLLLTLLAARFDPRRAAAAYWTCAGLALAGLAVLALFVLPNWTEYRFYNWQMSVTRKPAYTIKAFLDRASWLPIIHDFFTRMWLVTTAASLGLVAIVARWRSAKPAERVLVLWILLAFVELVIHDSGNERRYVMFIPAMIAIAAIVLSGRDPVLPRAADVPRAARIVAVPLIFFVAYLVVGAMGRLLFLYEVGPGVRLSASIAAIVAALLLWRWRRITDWISRQEITALGAAIVVIIVCAGDLMQFRQWAATRTYENYHASRRLAEVLPEGTLVHGKLANGLALENRIRPIFVGRGFGNYDDRRRRDDVRYILTYVVPRIGYEGSVIQDVLEAYPNRRVVMTFDVAETPGGQDRAALIDKFGGGRPGPSGVERLAGH